jgi:hypothetical protein
MKSDGIISDEMIKELSERREVSHKLEGSIA